MSISRLDAACEAPARGSVLPSGYLDRVYMDSLAGFGEPRHLPFSGGWLLERPVPGSPFLDALGGDGHLFCADWSRLHADLDALEGIVSLTAVTDPFCPSTPDYLRRCFPDLVRPYKDSFIVDLPAASPRPEHRTRLRRALRSVDVSVHAGPAEYINDWQRLYEVLAARHGLRGMRLLSRAALADQLRVAGAFAFRATLEGRCVSMSLWYRMGEVAHYHLGSSDADGYRVSASYALFQAAIETFAALGVRSLNLGAGPGATPDPADGLSRFKRGWANRTLPVYLCGRVYDRPAYERLAAGRPRDYFPAYRQGELD